MTSEIVLPSALPVPADNRLGQGTAVEMSRAVAEVHAAMYAARQFPRDEDGAIRSMENSCRQLYVAEKAFYRLPRAGSAVTGPTVHLARELARCWGHIQYGIVEMRRDDDARQSEMQAFAWDVQTGTRPIHTFIVPHRRDKTDKKTGVKSTEDLASMQEIYESNTNAASRRLRELIFAVLPSWYRERATNLCNETLATGDGTPLNDRIENAIAGFRAIGVSPDQLEKKLNLARIRWTGHEVAQLGVTYRSIQRGEVNRDDEFPAPIVTPEEITGGNGKPATRTASKPPAAVAQVTALLDQLDQLGLDGDYRVTMLRAFAGRQDITSAGDLTAAEAAAVLARLRELTKDRDGDEALMAIDVAVSARLEEMSA